ncbi:MAG: FAD-dependent thymidylate synthase [Candidatus Jorgensenbacteria bacterium]
MTTTKERLELETHGTKRLISEGAEKWLGVPIKCLDQGFVYLVDYMGNDYAIVRAARVSYGQGTKNVQDDRGLIRYLMRHNHTTPFEMAELGFHVRVPMDCWRQWIRHRTANVNEYSTRYSIAVDATQKTPPDGWRRQSKGNKQGSEGLLEIELGKDISEEEEAFHEHARSVYKGRIVAGVAREQARKDLPLSTYTEAYWKMDLHNLLHFLGLRLDVHAQEEIRIYATAMACIVKDAFPLTFEAFEDYRLHALTLSRLETEFVKGHAWPQGEITVRPLLESAFKNKREIEECLEKLKLFGFVV